MVDVIMLDSGDELDVSCYPLPDGIGDETFNRDQLARAMNVSVVTITKWVDAGMPVSARGGNGASYQFLFSHCYAWRRWREQGEEIERQTKMESAAQKAMLFINDDEEEDRVQLTPKMIKEMSEAELIRNKAAEQRGDLLRRAQVERVMQDVLAGFQNAIMGLPDWMEQEFGLDPRQADKAQKFCEGVLQNTRGLLSRASLDVGAVVPLREEVRQGDL